MLTEILRTWKTSLAGTLAGTLVYLNSVGLKVPATKNEWGALLIGAALTWLGIKADETR